MNKFKSIFLNRLTLCSLAFQVGTIAFPLNVAAKTFNLPKGIGIWNYGYRSYDSMTLSYDRNGQIESIGDGFKQNFNGPSLLNGSSSGDLGTLAQEVNRFEYAGDKSGVLAGLDLGTFGVDVEATVNTHIFGLGYGVTDWLTVYAGVPLINVNVSTNMYMTGKNTASDLKRRLGDLSYEELKDGLDTASTLDVAMIQGALEEMGYTGLEHWEHTGLGDINLGFATSYSFRPTSDLGFTPYSKFNMTIPIAHEDDPDILTDTSTGYGYFSASLLVGQVFSVGRYYYGGIEGSYQYNFNHLKAVRRPESEGSTLAPYENGEIIEVDPGDESEVSIYAGAEYWIFSGEYKLSDRNAKSDALVGIDDSIYDSLINNSEKNAFSQKMTASITTVDLYKKKTFPIPFIFSVAKKTNLSGKNAIIDDYFEVELSSFFTFN